MTNRLSPKLKKADSNKILHIYTRVSSSAQANEGTSLKTQFEMGQKKAKQLKFGYKHWDEGGKSSFHEDIKDRPKLAELYQAIKDGEVKHLWVYDESRLSRNDNVASIFRYECNKQGVTLYTNNGQLDLSNPNDLFLKQIFDAVAALDNANRAEKTRIGKLARVQAGYWHGGPPPFGYKIENKKLALEKTEAKWVKKIYEETLKGSSTVEIKKMLDAKGVLPRRQNSTWSIGSIQSLITNTHYKGFYTFQDKKTSKLLEITCPAIVDEVTWKAVQEIKTRSLSRVSQKNRTTHFYLLRDLMFCGHCGRPMAGRMNPKKHEALYFCPNKSRDWVVNGGTKTPWKRGENCGMARSLNIPEADQMVWDAVTDIHKNSSVLREEVKWKILHESGAPLAKSEEDIRLLERSIKKIQRDLEQAKQAQADLVMSHHSGELKADIYKIALARSKEKIENLEIQQANIQVQIRGNAENKKWVNWVGLYGEQIQSKNELSDEEKRDYLTGLIERISVKYIAEKNEHQLTLQFHMAIVNDGITWNDPDNRRKGYKVKKGKKTTSLEVKKKDPRWVKITPKRNHSVTVE